MTVRYLLILLSFTLSGYGCSQSRLLLTGSSYLVIDNSAKVVIENPAPNAVSTTGTGGIMTESEFDQLIWKIGTGTGSYTIPFVSQAAVSQIPFTLTIATAGTGPGLFRFSTYPGAVADNNTYRPSDVTHMFDFNTGSVNNSNHTIDRFWIVDASGYAIRPNATLQFTYRDAEHLQVGNSIIEGGLGAQRFNSISNQWGDYLPQGMTNTTANTTSNVPAGPADFFRSWTLSEVTHPLAVELSYFKSSCAGNGIVLNWQTVSETQTDHFEIEHYDGTFTIIGAVAPEEEGQVGSNYSFHTGFARSGTFQLVEVTKDGHRIVLSAVAASCENNSEAIAGYSSEQTTLTLVFESESESVEQLQVYDTGGKLIFLTDLEITRGINSISVPGLFLSSGIYFVRLKNGQTSINEKVIATP